MNPLKQIAPQVDPITGMAVQPGQIQPNPMINSRALGGAQATTIPAMFSGSAFQQKKQTQTKSSLTAGLLNAKDSKEAAKATKAITDAQKKALAKKKLKEAAAEIRARVEAKTSSEDVVSGERKKQ
jgi:hypothetical protein|tara:strand:- start:234 stop:611 length:378 start_codon:yes stop_codon:yes gene_type:complete